MKFEDPNNEIRREQLRPEGEKKTDQAYSVVVPILPSEFLVPFELPVEGSKIANLLRNTNQELPLDKAIELVCRLTPFLSQDPGGALQLFDRTWQIFDSSLNQTVQWRLQMSSSLYDPDIVIRCSIKPYRILVSDTIRLSSEQVTEKIGAFSDLKAHPSLVLRLAPGAALTFDQTFLAGHSVSFRNSEARLADDWSFFASVEVFHNSALGCQQVALPYFGEIYLDQSRPSNQGALAIFGILEKEGRWHATVSKHSDSIEISNTGSIPLKVRIAPGPHKLEFGDRAFAI